MFAHFKIYDNKRNTPHSLSVSKFKRRNEEVSPLLSVLCAKNFNRHGARGATRKSPTRSAGALKLTSIVNARETSAANLAIYSLDLADNN